MTPRILSHRLLRPARLAGLSAALALSLAPTGAAVAAPPLAQWCPGSLGYGDPGCGLFSTVQNAVDAAVLAAVPGSIFVESGTFAESVVIDGLDGVYFQGEADLNGPTTIDGPVTILNSANIDLWNFTITGGLSLAGDGGAFALEHLVASVDIRDSHFDDTGVYGYGLVVNWHTGPIVLEDVTAGKNSGPGVFLNNAWGGPAPVLVQSSRFDQNAGYGLRILAAGTVTLTDVSASKNGSSGAIVDTSTGPTAAVWVTVDSASQSRFDGNGGTGLNITAGGGITLINVSARKNGNLGAALDNTAGTSPVQIEGMNGNRFEGNGGSGLEVASNNTINLLSASVSKNGNGAELDNTTGTGGIVIGQCEFNKNQTFGLLVHTTGTIQAADVSAGKNGDSGALLDGAAGVTLAADDASLNRFDGNAAQGLIVTSGGTVSLSDVSASKNGLHGAAISAADVILATGAASLNRFDKNDGYGLSVTAGGSIALADVSASKNGFSGLLVFDGDVTLTTLAAGLNRLEKNGQEGLYAYLVRSVVVENTRASGNGTAGGSWAGLYLDTSDDSGPATVTCSAAAGNSGDGVFAYLVGGTLTLNSVTFGGNGGLDVNLLLGGGPVINAVACP